jgi:DNA-binding PadR family transcriptional regulator
MARESRSRYALLGILSMGPMSGYDIKQWIDECIGYFWNESYGQIYPVLKQLVAEGLANRTVEEQTGKPDRVVYTLTGRGREALKQWLVQPARHDPGRIEIVLKLLLGRQVTVGDNIRLVEQYQALQQHLLQTYEAIEQRMRVEDADSPDLPYSQMAVRHGRLLTEARLAWCAETLAALGEQAMAEGASEGGEQ